MTQQIDHRQVQNQAREDAKNGRYAEALQGYQWYHDNALQIDPNLRGVRLSFALSDWKQLGDIYPPALAALHATLERNEQQLWSPNGSWQNFKDIEAINRELGNDLQTCYLYFRLREVKPELAHRCRRTAFWLLAEQGKYEDAYGCNVDFRREVTKRVQRLNDELEHRPWSRPERVVTIRHHLNDLKTIGDTLSANGESRRAKVLLMAAARRIKDSTARMCVYVGLYPDYSDWSDFRKSS